MSFKDSIPESVRAALVEDIGAGDLTADLVPENVTVVAHILCRQHAVLCGTQWVTEVFAQLDQQIQVTWHMSDGHTIKQDDIVCHIKGPVRSILSGERTALNFLQTLSGTATVARQYVEAISGTRAKVLDTRKTIPLLRQAQKYAVQCGGAENHRMGLYDGILIKENHINACGSIDAALNAVSHVEQDTLVEIEVETLEQLKMALNSGAKRILLDNMSIDELKKAVSLNQGQALLEASGGISIGNIRAIAETGVDYISVGELTKNLISVDFSLRIE